MEEETTKQAKKEEEPLEKSDTSEEFDSVAVSAANGTQISLSSSKFNTNQLAELLKLMIGDEEIRTFLDSPQSNGTQNNFKYD